MYKHNAIYWRKNDKKMCVAKKYLLHRKLSTRRPGKKNRNCLPLTSCINYRNKD